MAAAPGGVRQRTTHAHGVESPEPRAPSPRARQTETNAMEENKDGEGPPGRASWRRRRFLGAGNSCVGEGATARALGALRLPRAVRPHPASLQGLQLPLATSTSRLPPDASAAGPQANRTRKAPSCSWGSVNGLHPARCRPRRGRGAPSSSPPLPSHARRPSESREVTASLRLLVAAPAHALRAAAW